MRDEEFDLRPYLKAIGRNWRWIVAAAALAAITTVLIALLLPREYVATSSVLIRRLDSQIALDPRFVTNDAPDFTTYRQGMLAMARSEALEANLTPETRAALKPMSNATGTLNKAIDVSLTGNLLAISAHASTAVQAKVLADAWTAAFVDNANAAYNPAAITPEAVDAELEDGRTRLAIAQRAYEAHIATSRQAELDHEIAGVTDTLERARKADQDRYTLYLSRVQELDGLIDDVTALRDDLAAGRAVNLGDQLASLALRARATNSISLPIQMQIAAPQVLSSAEDVTPARLTALAEQLHAQRAAFKSVATDLANALANDTATDQTTLAPAERTAYFSRLQELQRTREADRATEQTLAQDRDVALEALQVLQRKIAEQQITATSSAPPLRIANAAMLPLKPVGRKLFLRAGTSAIGGALLAMLVAGITAGMSLSVGAQRSTRRKAMIYARPADKDLAPS